MMPTGVGRNDKVVVVVVVEPQPEHARSVLCSLLLPTPAQVLCMRMHGWCGSRISLCLPAGNGGTVADCIILPQREDRWFPGQQQGEEKGDKAQEESAARRGMIGFASATNVATGAGHLCPAAPAPVYGEMHRFASSSTVSPACLRKERAPRSSTTASPPAEPSTANRAVPMLPQPSPRFQHSRRGRGAMRGSSCLCSGR